MEVAEDKVRRKGGEEDEQEQTLDNKLSES